MSTVRLRMRTCSRIQKPKGLTVIRKAFLCATTVLTISRMPCSLGRLFDLPWVSPRAQTASFIALCTKPIG